MPINQIVDSLPTPPSSGDPVNFRTRADAFVAALVTFVTQLNLFRTQANDTETNINAKEASAAASAVVAASSANFQGKWTNQTTVVGQSWLYNGVTYRVLIAGNTSPITSPANWAVISRECTLQSTIASAATTNIGVMSAGDTVHISGTTTITSFGTSTSANGLIRIVVFDGALTLTHNATSLILPTKANIITAAGDIAEFVCENTALGYWRCTGYQRANGDALNNKQLQPITASVATNALTVTLNPTTLDFRNTPLTSGTINTRTVANAISLVVPSTATLGTTNAVSARLVLLAIDNAGTVELAITNIAGGLNLDETTLINTTAISVAATSASIIYSTTARTGVPFRVVGFIDIIEATAGTWATAPSTIQGSGGQALVGFNAIRMGTAVASTSGTSIDFTGIPLWAKRITVMFNGVSTNGTSLQMLQLGSTTIEISGYVSGSNIGTTAWNAITSATNGFQIANSAAVYSFSGSLTLVHMGSNTWQCSAVLLSSFPGFMFTAGSKTLAGVLDRVRITTVNGTDTFDAGSINIMYEG